MNTFSSIRSSAVRTDPRYVEGDDARAVLVAWGGSSKADAQLLMGGWTERESIEDFLAAIQDEACYGAGGTLPYIEIIDLEDRRRGDLYGGLVATYMKR